MVDTIVAVPLSPYVIPPRPQVYCPIKVFLSSIHSGPLVSTLDQPCPYGV